MGCSGSPVRAPAAHGPEMATLAPMPSPSMGLGARIRCRVRQRGSPRGAAVIGDVRLMRYMAPWSDSASVAVGAPAMIQSHEAATDSPTCSSGWLKPQVRCSFIRSPLDVSDAMTTQPRRRPIIDGLSAPPSARGAPTISSRSVSAIDQPSHSWAAREPRRSVTQGVDSAAAGINPTWTAPPRTLEDTPGSHGAPTAIVVEVMATEKPNRPP